MKELLKEFYRKAWQDRLCGMFRRDELTEEYLKKMIPDPKEVGDYIYRLLHEGDPAPERVSRLVCHTLAEEVIDNFLKKESK